MTLLHVPFQQPGEHSLLDISMETLSKTETGQRVTTETCSASRPSRFPPVLSLSLKGLIRLSLYESSIRSSVPPSYGSLVLYSFTLYQKEALCQIPTTFYYISSGFSLCQCHWKELEGDLSFVAELQRNMQSFLGFFFF